MLDKEEAAALAKAIRVNNNDTPEPEEEPDERPRTAIADNGIGVAVTTSAKRKQHRRSRSADDLRRMALSLNPPRPRRDEVQFWRQSIAGTLPRRVVPVIIDTGKTREGPVSTDDSQSDDPFVVPAAEQEEQNEVSSAVDDDAVDTDMTAVAGPGDLETRVLKLESDLANFQGALERLSAQQNRRTVVLEGSTPSRSRRNTPSVLVNSLLDADYRYSTYSATGRDAYTTDAPESSAAAVPQTPLTARPAYQPASPSHSRNFSRLHTMIDQERHARRTLEDQVRELQQSVMDMQDQLAQPIMRLPASRRSQMPPQAYLRQEQIRPTSDYNDRSHLEAPSNRLTSRFSMSESLTDSEAARLRSARTSGSDVPIRSYDELPTPVDGQYRRSGATEGDMF